MNRHRCQPAQLRYTSMEEITGDLVALTYRCPTCNRSYLYPIRYRAITASRADRMFAPVLQLRRRIA